MTLGGAAAAQVRFIAWCRPFGEPHGFAGCRDRQYQVEPATASLRAAEGGTVPIPPKWREDTASVSLFQWLDAARLFSLREPPCRHGDDRNRGALAAGVDMP